MAFYVAVGGTGAYDGEVDPSEWYHQHSPWARYMAECGLHPLDPTEAFIWDGELEGLFWPWQRQRKHLVWMAAAVHLRRYLRGVPLCDRNLVCHSHGGQIGIYCALLEPINRLVTIATPVRQDMHLNAVEAVKNMAGGWRALYSPGWSDRLQILGTLFDGALRIERRFLIPGVINVGIPGIGHSQILNRPELFPLWCREGVVSFLKGELESV